MNLYFLVEGKTESKLYPKWITYLIPNFSRISVPSDADKNNYFLISGGGFPHLLYRHLRNSIDDVNSSGNYDYLVLCLDADEQTVSERLEEVNQFIRNENLILENSKLKIIVQNRCIETWLLGNRVIYPRQAQSTEFVKYSKFYNVAVNDPELMGIYNDFDTYAQFHLHYLKAMLLERNIKYTKNYPRDVIEEYYLNQLIKRTTDEKQQLMSFRNFIEFCEFVRLNSEPT